MNCNFNITLFRSCRERVSSCAETQVSITLSFLLPSSLQEKKRRADTCLAYASEPNSSGSTITSLMLLAWVQFPFIGKGTATVQNKTWKREEFRSEPSKIQLEKTKLILLQPSTAAHYAASAPRDGSSAASTALPLQEGHRTSQADLNALGEETCPGQNSWLCFLPLRLLAIGFEVDRNPSQRSDAQEWNVPSRDIPTDRHFLKRHCWHLFLFILMIEQLLFFKHFLYWMFCWMLLLKNPCKQTNKQTNPHHHYYSTHQILLPRFTSPRAQPTTLCLSRCFSAIRLEWF